MCTYITFFWQRWNRYHQGQQQDHGMGAGPSENNYMLGWLPYDTNSI